MPAPRTIALVTNSAWNLWNFRRQLIEALITDGHRVHLLSPPGPEVDRLTALGATHHALRRFHRSGVNPLRDLALTNELRGHFRRLVVTDCLLFTIKAVIYGSLAARLSGVRSFATLTGLGYAFIRGGLTTRLVSQLYRRALRFAHHVLFHNADDRQLFLDQGLTTAAKSSVVPGSGLPLADYPLTPYDRAQPNRVLFIGRLLTDKGIRDYVAAAALVRAQYPEVTFAVLGGLDPANPAAVTATELQSWTAAGTVDHLGRTEDVRPYIVASSLVVLPSYREGCPRVLLEAGALGRAVVGTDVPGVRQVVADGETGRLVPLRNPTILAETVLDLLQDPERLAAYGRAGHERVGEHFSARVVVNRYRSLLEATQPYTPSTK